MHCEIYIVKCSAVGADSARHFEGIELFPARHLLERYGVHNIQRDEDQSDLSKNEKKQEYNKTKIVTRKERKFLKF